MQGSPCRVYLGSTIRGQLRQKRTDKEQEASSNKLLYSTIPFSPVNINPRAFGKADVDEIIVIEVQDEEPPTTHSSVLPSGLNPAKTVLPPISARKVNCIKTKEIFEPTTLLKSKSVQEVGGVPLNTSGMPVVMHPKNPLQSADSISQPLMNP